ncbi:MAG: serine hydrolase [Bacteroidales bacterium]
MRKIFVLILLLGAGGNLMSYPIDGYETTGIRRLLYLQLVLNGELTGRTPKPGAMLGMNDIRLRLTGPRGDSLEILPAPDEKLQKAVDALFPILDESYSIAVLDITEGKPLRYAKRKEKAGYQPGSVAKLVIVAALFHELQQMYPDSFEKRQELLRNTYVRGGKWVNYDEHTIPVFDTATKTIKNRVAVESDVFNLYEWADHMISASNNGAANVVWREVILMHVFGREYPSLTPEQAESFLSNTPRGRLSEMAVDIVNTAIRQAGIPPEELRLGSFFTGSVKSFLPGTGGSLGTPIGFMKYLVAVERGLMVDEASSLEIKRLMYATATRIRYASSPHLDAAAVYFKSGSLYQCEPEEGYDCQKYMGNKSNYMNSVIIVEQKDGNTYLVALMSNVLKRNSAVDHNALASKIDRVIKNSR